MSFINSVELESRFAANTEGMTPRQKNAGAPDAPASVQERLIDLKDYWPGERTLPRRRIIKATVHKPPPISISDLGSGAAGPGFEEKVPDPAAWNGPAAGNAWLRSPGRRRSSE